MKQKLKTTPLLRPLMKQDEKIKVFQGGTGSGKTWTILQRIIIGCLSEWEEETIDIVRRTLPALKRSIWKDFKDIMKGLGLYDERFHNKTEGTYRLGTNTIRYYSCDDEEKLRGSRRDRVYLGEVLEMKKMDVMQILMRTRKEAWADFNPSEEFSWFYDEVLPRDDVFLHKSTYKDNPFLEDEVIDEIERLQETDENLWRIYGLGEKGVARATVFTNWDYAERSWEEFEGRALLGLDLGYNDPNVLVRVKYHREEVYSEELLRGSQMTSDDLIEELDSLVEQDLLDKRQPIICDSSRPEVIEALKRAGYNAKSTKKGPDSVMRGINFILSHKWRISKDSVMHAREVRGYKWRTDKDGNVLDKPVDYEDHSIDAVRYALEPVSKGGVVVGGLGGPGSRERRKIKERRRRSKKK